MRTRTRPKQRALDLEATIGELAPGGDGVAVTEIEGQRRAIFVRGAAPGDRVRLLVDASRRPARGELTELIDAGPDRVTPVCPHVGRCGGCDWMHLSLEAQARAHAEHARRALPETWQDFPIATHLAPEPLAYRTRARVHIEMKGGRAIVGMNEAGTRSPVEVDACAVLHPMLDEARRKLAALLEGCWGHGQAQLALGAFLPGGERRPVLDLWWTGSLEASFFSRMGRGVALGEWGGARMLIPGGTRPAIIGDPVPWMMGADAHPLRLAPGGFAQASDAANSILARRVAELASIALSREPLESRRALELFAGAGNFSVLLASITRELTTVESNRDACEAARANLEVRSLAAKVAEGDAEAWLWSPSVRLLVLDPPREGARDASARLVTRPVRHVLYVSCDTQTLRRDLAPLADAGYAPRAVETFEMFAQTSHVETVVLMERARS